MNLRSPANSDELSVQERKCIPQSIPGGEVNIHSILALEEEIRGHERAISKLKRAQKLSLNVPVLPSQSQLAEETNVDSVRTLEEQIKEHKRPIIEFKRTQNSLLNISRLPPEVLGDIFCRNAIPEQPLEGFEKRSYNFLLVCHHWFEVASCTPELWSFWGNNPQDWAKRCLRYPAAPVDLALDGVRFPGDALDATLRKALQDRAAADAIRLIHLIAEEPELLSSVISPLTANCEGIRSSSVESIIIWNDQSDLPVDISDFFAHYRFPKLYNLELVNCAISSWDLITSRTSVLTFLDFYFEEPTPDPTTAQLLSIFSSNPGLQTVRLTGCTVPDDVGDMSSLRVPLHNLGEFNLTGDLQSVVRLLHRLDCSRNTDIILSLQGGVAWDIPHILGPCLRDYLHRRCNSQDGMELSIFWTGPQCILFEVDDWGWSLPGPEHSFMVVKLFLSQSPPKDLLRKAILDLIAEIPREEIFSFLSNGNTVVMEDVFPKLPNLRELTLTGVTLSAALPETAVNADEDVLPFLQSLSFSGLVVINENWGPLTTFLSRRASSGNRLVSLTIDEFHYLLPEVVEDIRSLVGEFAMGEPEPEPK